MFINPKTAIEQGWITHPLCNTIDDWEERKFISPNAIDFTLDIVHTINQDKTFQLSETNKTHRGGDILDPIDNQYTIQPNTSYDCLSDMYVNIPNGIACELIIRSTLSRNGIFLTSGIYDSKYSGHLGWALHNNSGLALIESHTRVGQIKFFEADNETGYEGGYNHTKGTHWK